MITKDDVYKLAMGKPTKHKIGSRAVAARLTKHEWKKFEIAQESGFLKVNSRTSQALKHIWHLYCLAENIECQYHDDTQN